MLVGQLWANIVPYCNWLINIESEAIELCDIKDGESEEELEKKEKEDKIRTDLFKLYADVSVSTIKNSFCEDSFLPYHPEITTPPPERS